MSVVPYHERMSFDVELKKLTDPIVQLQDPKNGNTTIHLAAQNGNLKMVELIIMSDAKVNMQNKGGQTALHMVRASC